MQEQIYQRLSNLVCTVFELDEVELAPETIATDVDGWDSIGHVRLVLACEREFGVKFSTSEIAQFENVGQLVEIILRKLG